MNTDSTDRQIYSRQNLADRLIMSDGRVAHDRCLLQRIATIVWVADRSGEAQGEQVDWTAFTGQTGAQSRAGGWLAAVHPADRAATASAWATAVELGTLFHVQYQLRHHSGDYRWMDVQGVPVCDRDGQVVEWCGCHVDITERKLAQIAHSAQARELTQLHLLLTQLTAAGEQRDREFDRFIYTIAHDLQAPLRAIANLSQWIEDDLTGQSAHNQQLQLLRRRVNLIQAMLDGLLVYSRIGRREVRTETVVVAELVADVVDSLAPPANFAIAIAADLPTLHTNRESLAQVFFQLIGNAIHHHHALAAAQSGSPPPVAQIQITGHPRSDSYQFAVTDDGPGIASTHHEAIFEIFRTLATKADRPGMGLAIVKKIVEAEGGQVGISSTVGEGSTFHFTWSGVQSSNG